MYVRVRVRVRVRLARISDGTPFNLSGTNKLASQKLKALHLLLHKHKGRRPISRLFKYVEHEIA